MPHRFVPVMDSILMTIFPIFLLVTSFGFISVISAILSLLWWVTKFKRDIEKYHNNSIKEWFKWLVKKKQK